MKALVLALVLLCAPWPGGASAVSAAGCGAPMPAGAEAEIDPAGGIDRRLFDATILAETNHQRCRAGRQALAAGPALARAAQGHSDWMARTGRLSHRSDRAGTRTLPDRLRAAGVGGYGFAAENIGSVARFGVAGQRFRVVDAARCRFADAAGAPLPGHSYASLARRVVALWMDSPGHRRNILDRQARRMGAAMAFDPRAPHCGRYWITQVFAG